MTDVREEFITALVDLDEVKCLDIAKQRLEAGEDPFTILEDLREGTDRIGKMFEDGRFFVSDLMMAGEILKQNMEGLKPALGGGSEAKSLLLSERSRETGTISERT